MPPNRGCHLDVMLTQIGDRWSLGILHNLTAGPMRTLELHAAFTGLSTRTLAERLKRLEANGLILRKSFPESPPRVEYALTERGRELAPVLDLMKEAALKLLLARGDAAGPWARRRVDSHLSCPACGLQNGMASSKDAKISATAQRSHQGQAGPGKPAQRAGRGRSEGKEAEGSQQVGTEPGLTNAVDEPQQPQPARRKQLDVVLL
jgi:DNA-binding HxlR family transcriptional regulator